MTVRTPVFVAFAFLSSVAAAENLVWNADMSLNDGMGEAYGWGKEVPNQRFCVTDIEVRPTDSDGTELTFWGPPGPLKLAQSGLTLRPGGRYRLSCEVRTTGLADGFFDLAIWNDGRRANVHTPHFPSDTKGKWETVEFVGEIPESASPSNYAVTVNAGFGVETRVRVNIRNLSLVALDDESAAVSKPRPPVETPTYPIRIVPIDPLLAEVSHKTGSMTFYWPGLPPCGLANCRLAARVDGGKAVFAALGEDGRATVAFGRLAYGEHKVDVAVADAKGKRLAKNAYRIVVKKPVPKGPKGKRLNNFVTQLVKGPLANGETRFFRERDGWVWISFDGDCGDAKGYLDGSDDAVVRRREGERRVETQRYVTAGWHTLKVTGATGGRLRIHAIKMLGVNAPDLGNGPCCVGGGYRFNKPFALRFDMLFTFNSINDAFRFYFDEKKQGDVAYYRDHGMYMFFDVMIQPSAPERNSVADSERVLRGKYWEKGLDICVDENRVDWFMPRRARINFGEAAWNMVDERPERRIHANEAGPELGSWYWDPRAQASGLSAVVNSGDGTGLIIPEFYPMIFPDSSVVTNWARMYARFYSSMTNAVPAARSHMHSWFATWIANGGWTCYNDPSTDIKAFYAKLMRIFAVDPRFAENEGIGYGGMIAGEEEIRRWGSKCIRYHALEGGTEDLSEKYDFPLVPGYVKNPDFFHGSMDGWTAVPAPGGGIEVKTFPGAGVRIQTRHNEWGFQKKNPWGGLGDDFAVFTSSAAGANELRQKITGLKRGECYMLLFAWGNEESIENDKIRGRERACSVRLEGAEELTALADPPPGTRWGGAHTNFRRVFRAKRPEGALVFSDRRADGGALAPGSRQALNYIIFRRYYREYPGEEDEIARLYVGGAGTVEQKK